MVGVVAAVGIGLGAGALAVPSDKSQPQSIVSGNTPPVGSSPIGNRRVGAPASFGAYKRVRDATGRQAVARVRAALTGSDPRAAAFSHAAIALYRRSSDSPEILFVANDVRNDAVISLIQEAAPSQDSLDFLAGTGATAIQQYRAGPLGGSLRCGGPGQTPYPACAWVDDSSLGWVVDYGGSAPAKLAALVRKLRRAAEH